MSKLRLVLIAATCVCAAAAAAPSAADAAPCYSSTPTSNYATDSANDGDAGVAPELTSVSLAVGNACDFGVAFGVSGQSSPLAGDFYGWFINADNNSATGPQSGFVGAEYAIGLSDSGVANLSYWNGSTYVNAGSASRIGSFAVSTALSSIGAAPGVPISVAGGASWTYGGDSYYDFAPDPGLTWPAITPTFLTTPPPSAGGGNGGTSGSASECVVPNVRGLKLASAKSKIRHAGCSIGATRKRVTRSLVGRVLKTSPGKGAHLAAGADVSIYVGKHAHKAHASAASNSPDLSTLRINQLLAHAPQTN